MAGDRAPLTPDQGAETPVMLALLPAGSPVESSGKKRRLLCGRSIIVFIERNFAVR